MAGDVNQRLNMKTNMSFFPIQRRNGARACVLAVLLLVPAAPSWGACVYDTSFDPAGTGGANDAIYALGVLGNFKIVVGGSFTHMGPLPRPRLAILNSDGSLDQYFYINPNNTVRAIAVQLVDNKFLIGGDFTTVYGAPRPYLARIPAAYGYPDSLVVTNLNSSVLAIALQPDGKILIGGSFTSPKPGIARLTTSGGIDTTFNPGVGTDNGSVYAIAVNTIPGSPNYGKIYIGGNFLTYGGVSRPRVARLNANGSLDTGFAPVPNNNIYAVAVQTLDSEERVLLGGAFTHDSFFVSDRFARLHPDGGGDHAFNFSLGVIDSDVRSIAIQADGEILIGGQFTQAGSPTAMRKGIARFHATGGLDVDWNTCGSAANPGTIWTMGFQYGNIVVGGSFTQFDGYSHWMSARLFANP